MRKLSSPFISGHRWIPYPIIDDAIQRTTDFSSDTRRQSDRARRSPGSSWNESAARIMFVQQVQVSGELRFASDNSIAGLGFDLVFVAESLPRGVQGQRRQIGPEPAGRP